MGELHGGKREISKYSFAPVYIELVEILAHIILRSYTFLTICIQNNFKGKIVQTTFAKINIKQRTSFPIFTLDMPHILNISQDVIH